MWLFSLKPVADCFRSARCVSSETEGGRSGPVWGSRQRGPEPSLMAWPQMPLLKAQTEASDVVHVGCSDPWDLGQEPIC